MTTFLLVIIMRIKQIVVNAIWFGVIPKITVLIHVILLPIITPYLTPFDYGIIGIVNSYMSIFILLSVLGLNVHLTNSFYVYGARFREVWRRILTLMLLSSILFSIIYAFIMLFVLTEISGKIKTLTIICACIPILLNGNMTLAAHYYPLVYRPQPLVVRNLLASLMGIIVTFGFIYYLRLGFLGWLAGSAVTTFAGFVLFISPIWIQGKIYPSVLPSFAKVKHWLKISFPVIPHSLGFILLGSSDRIIMQLLHVPVNEIGLYSNGYQMGDYAVILAAALITSVTPRIQELYRCGDFTALKRLFMLCQSLTIGIVVLLSVWMPQVYALLIRNIELQPACSIAVLVCFANIVFPFYSFMSIAAFIEEKTLKVLWLVFLPGVVNVSLNFIFIPIYGYKAAVFTTLIAYWSQLMIPYFVGYFRKIAIDLLTTLRLPLILLGVFVLLLVAAYWVASCAFLYKLLFSVFFITLFLFFAFRYSKVVY